MTGEMTFKSSHDVRYCSQASSSNRSNSCSAAVQNQFRFRFTITYLIMVKTRPFPCFQQKRTYFWGVLGSVCVLGKAARDPFVFDLGVWGLGQRPGGSTCKVSDKVHFKRKQIDLPVCKQLLEQISVVRLRHGKKVSLEVINWNRKLYVSYYNINQSYCCKRWACFLNLRSLSFLSFSSL